ncbi:MAG: hypothetical protein QGD92_05685 [Gammaproteobacteria bacterium]|nr:hypothetical protein [Gammaproteobacteria bacterium]
MGLLEELEWIHRVVVRDLAHLDPAVRPQFWRLVGQIKRLPCPDPAVIAAASTIRDVFYEQRLGKSISLQWLTIWFICGISFIMYYLWMLLIADRPTGDLLDDLALGAVVGGAMFFLYPFGRMIAGKLTGISFDGISRDIYYLPTLKINYPTYLGVSPRNRLWFFFMAGYWTAACMILIGFVGYLLNGEWLAIAFGLILACAETLGAIFGGKWAGELGHFNRELTIVRDWKNNL